MNRSPATKQRSQWTRTEDDDAFVAELLAAGATSVEVLWRNVGDGVLRAIVADEPAGWHLSISHARRLRSAALVPGRYPTWDEIADARYALCPLDIDMVMHLPPPDEYVAVHQTTFHLHQNPAR